MTAFCGFDPVFRGRLGGFHRPSSQPSPRGERQVRMRIQALLLALCLSACGDTPPAPAAIPAAPRHVEAGSLEAVEAQDVVLVAPGQAHTALETALVEAPAAVSTPERAAKASPSVAAGATTNSAEKVVKANAPPLARDRKGKIMGRGPTRANRPEVNMGMPSGKFSTPYRGRKIRNRDAIKAKQEAARKAQQEAEGEAGAGDPRR